MVVIAKSTLVSNIWENFYDRIKAQVTSVTLSISPGSQTVQTYTSSYSDVNFSSKSNFPIIVINPPRVTQEQFTLGKTQVNGEIEIEAFATNSQAADKLLDAINNSIETYKGDFADVGLHMLELDDTDNEFIEHGNIKVHRRRARWRFVYRYSRTTAY
jgi:hypothetical protein